jgi:hypothetical protein
MHYHTGRDPNYCGYSWPNKITGADSRPASPFERRGLRRRALVVESQGRYHGGAAVAQFGRSARADQTRTNTDVMKANPESKPTVVEPVVGLSSLALLAVASWELGTEN